MGAHGYTYPNGLFNEDHLPPTGSSPPPPYHIVVPDRQYLASTSHPQGQSSPILTTFQTLPRGTSNQGHAASVSPTSAYAVLASGIAGAQGQLYHQFVQVPYPGTGVTGYPPVPPGFPPPPQQSPVSAQQASAHLVPQPLPTHTGRDPGPVVTSPSSIQPNPPIPAHQQPASVSTSTSTPPATATNCAELSWSPEQDRLLLRLHKDEHKSHSDISAALDDVFQVKRDTRAVEGRLQHLRARSKAWSEEKLKQAAQKAMQSFSSLMQEELVSSLNFNDNEQSAALRLAVRLELDQMMRQGGLSSDMEQRLMNGQRERNAQYTMAMKQRDRGRDRDRVREDGDGDASGDQVEDYEIL